MTAPGITHQDLQTIIDRLNVNYAVKTLNRARHVHTNQTQLQPFANIGHDRRQYVHQIW